MSEQIPFSADEKLKENIEMLRDHLGNNGFSTIDDTTPLHVLIKTLVRHQQNTLVEVERAKRRLEWSEGQLDTIKKAFSIIQCR